MQHRGNRGGDHIGESNKIAVLQTLARPGLPDLVCAIMVGHAALYCGVLADPVILETAVAIEVVTILGKVTK